MFFKQEETFKRRKLELDLRERKIEMRDELLTSDDKRLIRQNSDEICNSDIMSENKKLQLDVEKLEYKKGIMNESYIKLLDGRDAHIRVLKDMISKLMEKLPSDSGTTTTNYNK